MQTVIKRLRIVAPPERVTDDANPDELNSGDTFEILDRPVYEVDPRTHQTRPILQQFVVATDRTLKPASQQKLNMDAIRNAIANRLR